MLAYSIAFLISPVWQNLTTKPDKNVSPAPVLSLTSTFCTGNTSPWWIHPAPPIVTIVLPNTFSDICPLHLANSPSFILIKLILSTNILLITFLVSKNLRYEFSAI